MKDVESFGRACAVVFVLAAGCLLGYGALTQCGCTPKAVDCRVEWLKAADAGRD